MIKITKLFDIYDLTGINVKDRGLGRYINLNPVSIPHTGAKYANRRFGKSNINIVERLINGMMRTEHTTGEKAKTYKIVKNAFSIIEKKTKKNPVQVLVDALQNAAPREEITRLQYGGISVPKAVDIAPLRRLDIALRNICTGAIKSSHKNRKKIENCLVDEIIKTSRGDTNAFSVSKRDEIERVASSAR